MTATTTVVMVVTMCARRAQIEAVYVCVHLVFEILFRIIAILVRVLRAEWKPNHTLREEREKSVSLLLRWFKACKEQSHSGLATEDRKRRWRRGMYEGILCLREGGWLAGLATAMLAGP